MAKMNPDDLQKLVDQEEDENYGEELSSASNPEKIAAKDDKELLEDFTGNEPEEGSTIGDEVDEDEEALREKPIDDYKAKVDEEELKEDEEKEDPRISSLGLDEDDATFDDPYDDLTDKDLKKKK